MNETDEKKLRNQYNKTVANSVAYASIARQARSIARALLLRPIPDMPPTSLMALAETASVLAEGARVAAEEMASVADREGVNLDG